MLLLRRSILRNLAANMNEGYASCSYNPHRNISTEHQTAGIIVIGDEILKAQVKDTNSHFMCKLLYESGVKVEKISVIKDKVDSIADEINEFSKKYTYVITSGGVGPTHDDVTFEALARAFNDSLHYHPTLIDIIKNQFNIKEDSSAGFKLAHIPAKALLRFGMNPDTGNSLPYPCIIMENVYVFPGSPQFFEKSFGSLCKELFTSDKNFVKDELYIDAKEESFAKALLVTAKEFPHMSFGSYPDYNHSYYKARVTIESNNEDDTKTAKERFCELVPPEILVNFDSNPCEDPDAKYENFVRCSRHRSAYEETFAMLEEIYQDSTKVAICFDGSIESTVLLHLAYTVNSQKHRKGQLQAVGFELGKPFPEVKDFIKQSVKRYHVNMITLDIAPQKAEKELLFVWPGLETLLLGIKSGHSKSGVFHSLAADASVGPIQIKCPLAEWSYECVWTFARSLSLRYCNLYDRGFTSIGDQNDTQPNPRLLVTKDTEAKVYRPAYTLENTTLE